MKKYIILFLLLWYIGNIQSQIVISNRSGSSGATCTLSDSINSGTNVGNNLFGLTGHILIASKHLIEQTAPICSLEIRVRNNVGDTPNVNYSLSVYSTQNDTPNTALTNGTSPTTYNPSVDFTETYTRYGFTFTSKPSVTAGDSVWIVHSVDGVDGTDYMQIEHCDGVTGVEHIMDSGDGSSWVDLSTSVSLEVWIYYEQ